jgi:hypothetical protein
LKVKDKRKEKEEGRDIVQKCNGPQDQDTCWTVVNRHQSADKNSNPETLRIRGKYKMLIRLADDGTLLDIDDFANKICSEKSHRVYLARKEPTVTTHSNTGIEGCYHIITVLESHLLSIDLSRQEGA